VAEISKKRPPYPCICCGFLTLTDPSLGSYEICEVCFWEDDPVQNEDPLFVGGANAVSLARARENYVHYCACQPSFSDRVPTSETRHLWSPEVLRIKDAEAAQYEHRVRSMVQNACQQLERYLTAELRS
jgi:hypothetical protein